MLGTVQGFGDAQRGWYSGLWGCSAQSGALGVLGEVGTQGVGDGGIGTQGFGGAR